jgi:tetratricopeptide (TPR) repeat protein
MICRKTSLLAGCLLAFTSVVRADTLWIGDTIHDAIKVDGLKVQGVKDGKLTYVTDQGMNASKPFAKVPEINIDGEANFNAAESAFAKGDFDAAISAYQTVLQSSSKDWILARAAIRLIAAAKVKNRYDAQVAAYVALLQKDPATAAANKPAEAPEHSQYLDAALASIGKALDNSHLEDAQKSTLLTLQLQINQAKGDNAAVLSTLQQLNALGGASDEMKATLKIADAQVAYQNKQYPQAIADIEQNKALFTDPDQQVDALFILAQAKYAANGDNADPDTLKDLAINFMRVVTFGSQLNDRPHVAESLYQTGQIEEQLKEPAVAAGLYGQIAKDRAYANSPVKAKADAALAKLQGAAK